MSIPWLFACYTYNEVEANLLPWFGMFSLKDRDPGHIFRVLCLVLDSWCRVG